MQTQTNTLQGFVEMVRRGGFVVLDTETTGLDGEVVQIAVIDDSGAVLVDTLVKPLVPIPPAATAVHGIGNAEVRGAPSWAAVTPQVEAALIGRDVVTYNALYDRRMLHHSAERAGLPKKDWRTLSRWWCAMEAFAEVYGEWNDYYGNYRWQKLATAARYYRLPVEGEHSALGDARMTLAVVRAMAEAQR